MNFTAVVIGLNVEALEEKGLEAACTMPWILRGKVVFPLTLEFKGEADEI